MKARRMLITAPRQIEWSEIELNARPKPGYVRVRTLTSLISPGTEMRLYRGESMVSEVWESFANLDDPLQWVVKDQRYDVSPAMAPGGATFPVMSGYNNIGEVIDIGDGVSSLKVGDRILSLWRHQNYFDVREWEGVAIPDQVSNEAASCAYLATLGLHALRRGNFSAGERVGIIGLGLIGLLTAIVADAFSSMPICFEVNPDRRRIAESAIPNLIVVDPSDAKFSRTVAEHVAPYGLDLVLEAGAGQKSIELALRVVGNDGRTVVIALHPENLGTLFSSDFYSKQAAFLGTSNDPYENPSAGRNRFTIAGNIAFILELERLGRISLKKAVTNNYSSANIDKAFQELDSPNSNMVGVCIHWAEN